MTNNDFMIKQVSGIQDDILKCPIKSPQSNGFHFIIIGA